MLSTRGSKRARVVATKWGDKQWKHSLRQREIEQKLEKERQEANDIARLFLTEWLIAYGTDWVQDSFVYTLDNSIAFPYAQSKGLAEMRRELIEDGALTFFPKWEYRVTEKGMKFLKENENGIRSRVIRRADGK